jgi:hypothetical protein
MSKIIINKKLRNQMFRTYQQINREAHGDIHSYTKHHYDIKTDKQIVSKKLKRMIANLNKKINSI